MYLEHLLVVVHNKIKRCKIKRYILTFAELLFSLHRFCFDNIFPLDRRLILKRVCLIGALSLSAASPVSWSAQELLPFLQGDHGIVSIEAEHYHSKSAATGYDWILEHRNNDSGEGVMRAIPEDKVRITSNYVVESPRLDYQIKFTHPGVYSVWIRSLGPRGSSNSVHIGLNGNPIRTGKDITVPISDNYTWTDGTKTFVNIPKADVYTLNLWMRESGTIVDKIVLSDDPAFIPSGKGPVESPGEILDDGSPVALPETPNIVLIMADDMGYSDLGSYGSEIETPNLDRLATHGIRFTNFYNAAKCEQSRATLMSGLYHYQTVAERGKKTQLMAAKNHVTIAEALKRGGYRTMISGKWGLIGNPLDRGFDRFFGFGRNAVDYFTGETFLNSGRNEMMLDRDKFEIPENGYYLTDTITDHAIEFVDEAVELAQPFFLFVSHYAPHFPLQAPKREIDKYRGKFMQGWDQLREQRLQRMRQLGVVNPSWPLSPREFKVPEWDSLTLAEQREQDLLMAVFAAMIDRMDQNIGRLMVHLDKRGVSHNTLVLFLSDNGGNDLAWDTTPDLEPGPARHYRSYQYWYNLSNTPFRRHKRDANEGGISTPAIAYWPAAINSAGSITDTLTHLIDLMPTFLDVAGVSYPKKINGYEVLPMEGVSFKPVLTGAGQARTEQPLYWDHTGSRAVRIGSQKLVATTRESPWQLYDMQTDRVELVNIIEAEPERAEAMRDLYDLWADRVGAP